MFIARFIKGQFEDRGMLLLKDYPNELIKEIIENSDAYFIIDKDKGAEISAQNVLITSKAKMAEYRNRDLKKFVVFITDDIIDTFSDINTIEKRDLEEKFDEIFDVKKEIKEFIKGLDEDIFDIEKYVLKVIELEKEGYTTELALGMALDVLGVFKCEECFKNINNKKRIKLFSDIKAAFEKRRKNKLLSTEELLERYFSLKLQNPLLEEFIKAPYEEIIKNKHKYTKLDFKDDVYKLFEEEKKEVKKLGALTLEELEKRDIEINENDYEILKIFDRLNKTQKEHYKEQIISIFEEYKHIIEQNPKLLKDYENFIYPNKIEGDDFIKLILETLKGIDLQNCDYVEIELDKKQPKAIIKSYSYFAISYIQNRLLILNSINDKIRFKYKSIDYSQADKKFSKDKNTLRFNVYAYKDEKVVSKKRIVYHFKANSILSSFADDLETIKARGLFSCDIESNNLDLNDKKTYKTYTKNAYTLFSPTKAKFSFSQIKKAVKEELEEAVFLFDKFGDVYLRVLEGLNNLDFKNVEELKNVYVEILKILNKHRNNDLIREKITDKFLTLGMVFDKNSASIIATPFTPLNLIYDIYKLKYIFSYVTLAFNKKLEKKDVFFEELKSIYDSTFFEILDYKGFLTLKNKLESYLLFDDSFFLSIFNDNYKKNFLDIIAMYKNLYPYKDKIKILFYEIRNKKFIVDFVNSLSDEIEIDIYDREYKYLIEIYEEFAKIKNSEEEFLSFKEINILERLDNNKKFDIVFFNDFVVNFGKMEKLDAFRSVELEQYDSLILSKKKPQTSTDYEIGSFLLPPLKNELYLYFETMLKTEKLPAFLVNKKENSLIQTLKDIHTLSNWVVNIDSIVDKSILHEVKANVIKYKKDRNLNKNIIISSKADLKFLIDRIHEKLKNLKIFLKIEEIEKIIEEVNEISGDVLLKALGKGSYINELIGLYLSKKLIKNSLNDDIVIIYADDYKEWFEARSDFFNKKHFLTDLIVLKPNFGKRFSLDVFLVESKFISKENKTSEIDKSLKQTRMSYKLFKNYLSREFADSEFFIRKLANLIVEARSKEFSNGMTSADVRDKIVFDDVEFNLSAKSFIFVYDDYSDEKGDDYTVFSQNSIFNILHDEEKIEIKGEVCETRKVAGFEKNREVDEIMEIEKVSEVNEEKGISTTNNVKEDEFDVEFIKDSIKEIFRFHKLPAIIIGEKFTPNSLIVKLQPQLGWKAEKIESLVKDDFLTNKGLELLRVEAVAGSMNLVFKRKNRQIIRYRDIKNREVSNSGFGNTKILIGVDEKSGNLVYYDLNSESPHALVGGMTKSGKSVLLSEMIIDLINTNSLEDIELILIDPKKVEFILFEDSPYVKEVITEKDRAIKVLNSLVDEMEKRYDIMKNYKVKDINRLYEKTGKKLKRIVVVFDEIADWMSDKNFKEEVEKVLERLSQKARAAGIHLIISTQRPDKDVVSPRLRANLGAKFALKVDRDSNSIIILGEKGAENLLGYGHILAKFGGEKYYIQGCFLSEEEIEEYVKERA